MKYYKLTENDRLIRVDAANENVSGGTEIEKDEYDALLESIKPKASIKSVDFEDFTEDEE